jgi:Spy/CpxP family protein refolding chaperone
MQKRFPMIAASGLLVLGVALWGVQANAQAEPSGGQMGQMGGQMGGRMHRTPDEELQHLSKSLKLTDDQKNQIKPILADRQQKMHDLRSDTSVSPEDRRSKMKSIMDESNGKIRDVLNDDQKKKFDEMQQHRRGHMEGQGHMEGGGTTTTPQ